MRPITERLHHHLQQHRAVNISRHPELVSVVRSHVRRGALVAVLPGVYTSPGPDTDTLIAAVRAWDPDAVICGHAAARSTFAPRTTVRTIEIATRRRPRIHHPRLRFTRRHIPPEMRFRGHTHPTLTALDLAPLDSGETICTALREGWTTIGDLHAVLERVRRIHNPVRRRVVGASAAEPWSVAEQLLHQLLRRRQLPTWLTNHRVRLNGHTHYIDVAFPALRVAIELDGFEHHSTRPQFESDRKRQNRLVLNGWTILRFTWRMLTEHPDQVLDQITSAVARTTGATARDCP